MSDLPMIEPSTVAEAYALAQVAFELSEAVGTPVFLRLTTAVALAHSVIDCGSVDELAAAPPVRQVLLEKDVHRYTKAGSLICREQHAKLIERLERARIWVHDRGLNRLSLADASGGVGILSCGAVSPYLPEVLEQSGLSVDEVSILRATSTVPFPQDEAKALLDACDTVLVLEELEPHVERDLSVLAREIGWEGRIVGKLDGTLARTGEYGVGEIIRGLHEACTFSYYQGSPVRGGEPPKAVLLLDNAKEVPAQTQTISNSAARESQDATLGSEVLPAPRPITVCAGCPHRGTYLAIEAAIGEAGLTKDEVMVTGDIGCTILGMNPPFHLLWNEVSMGSSLGIAQGYVHAGVSTPVIATIGDSTFFHGGIPGLINAIQHRVPLTLVVMDNGWTAMTGMQVNPGTDEARQPEGQRVDLESVVRGLGPDRLSVVDPYDLGATTAAIRASLEAGAGVGVVIARRECAIQAARRGVRHGTTTVDPDKCILCKRCIQATACPALSLGERSIEIDPTLCNGCGLCVSFCPTSALTWKEAE